MRLLIIAAASLAVVSCARLSPEDLEFKEWKLKFEKSYSSRKEEAHRKNIWLFTRRRVLAHNILADQGIKTYRMGINQFSDMDSVEYRQTLQAHLNPSNITESASMPSARTSSQLPAYVNWRDRDCVTPVKDQGITCSSCWAFSVAAALESHTCIYHKDGRLPSLSEQQLVDCSRSYGNNGCGGGHVLNAFEYSMKNRNINEVDYPYQAKDSTCWFKKNIPKEIIGAHCLGYVALPPGDERELQLKVALNGPVSVNVDASKDSFKDYASGVYYEPLCGNKIDNITHAMLVVGYGTANELGDYWLVKNSYGTTWGEQGYIKMARNKDNNCAIAAYAFYPKVYIRGGQLISPRGHMR